MAEKLTPQQKMAVEDRGGRLLVSAAAGSGKTKVLVDRLLSYLLDPLDPANIDDFLIITYTKAAASELRGKIASKLAEKVAEDPSNRHLQRQQQRLYLAKISTVHAFCGDILREYAYRMDLSADFRVADEQECLRIRQTVVEEVLKEAYEHAATDPNFCAFVDSQGIGRDDRLVPQLLLQVYDASRCHLDPQKWLRDCLVATQAENCADAIENPYGNFLVERLRGWLQLQIDALKRCASICSETSGLEKVCALLMDTVFQLTALQECKTWDEIHKNRNVDFGRLVFPKNMDDEDLKNRIKAVRDACKKGLEKQIKPFADNSSQILFDLQTSTKAQRGLIQMVETFAKSFEQAKKNHRILDFSDLEHRMLDLLLGKSRTAITLVAKEIGSRFREVMVDEYQDSNAVQDAIYAALTNEKQNLFMVGDVKQSIYQFRLADPGIFLDKYKSFLPAEQAQPGQNRKVLLSRNFRSSGGVLAACNDVFSMCMCPEIGGLHYGDEEALYEGIPHIALPQPETELCCIDVRENTYHEEAAYVAHRIRQMLDAEHYVRDGEQIRPVRAEDIVILLRSPGSAGAYYEKALADQGINYTTGGGIDLLKTDEITAVRATLQVIQNPRLDIPLIAALASPVFGFTADDLAAIRRCKRTGDFLDAMHLHTGKKTQDFLKKLQKLRICANRESLSVLLQQLYRTTNIEAIYGAMEQGVQRIENLYAFYQLAADYESAGNRELGRFLEYLEGLDDHGLITPGENASQGYVTIMSIHKSKGLEFPVVFLCGLGREFNMESQRSAILCHKSMGLGLSVVDTEKRIRYPSVAKRAIAARIGQETLSEELRVLYVAMTRAKDRLIMTYASNRLEKDLQEVVQRLCVGGKDLLVREAVCPGEWVLLTALQKTEAGALFALAGRPDKTSTGDFPWKISVVQAPEDQKRVEQEKLPAVPPALKEQLQKSLSFTYAYTAATTAPSKMTATQRKGRIKDEEASQNTVILQTAQQWRKPGFANKRGKDFGNAMHSVLQYIRYAACNDIVGVKTELERLASEHFISYDQLQMVDANQIAAFFATSFGKKLQTGEVIREFKFSILEDGSAYDEALAGEQVLLQGVVDCALIEENGITIVDFKTDRVSEESVAARVQQYRPQVVAYAEALGRIYQKPVKQAMMYFFEIGKFIEM